MNLELLTTYLNDHRAGATAATDMLERLINENQGEPLGDFATTLLNEIEQDEAELEGLIKRYDAMPGVVKQAVAWAGAKMTTPKIGRTMAGDFGNFQTLEILSIGILGKRALWRMLQSLSDPELLSLDYGRLIERADSQFQQVEQWRLRIGTMAMNSTAAV
ncbi:hypothetical protein Pla52o_33970 [Novipirellula galeiformis]|uniref:Uncharacterized protein n=1 Tax=Novipirellula galeiformis TaxID=2528004 RepID=A0A5C6CGD6_9BACT|nr:hypothetical protein [Novipirellula galeiformis]TWU22341.1 hypothetical protein Pla52o_33970 [Novipirellula galeiformis]